MSLLNTLTTPIKRPMTITIAADGGLGKTELASLFPSVVFCHTEEQGATLNGRDDVAVFPLVNNSWELMDQIRALQNDQHEFKTLAIDSITQFNKLVEQEVLVMDPKAKSLNTALGGYGAGNNAVGGFHYRLREECRKLQELRGMNIVFIAHAATETINSPDTEPYTRYTLAMHKDSSVHYSNNVDVIAFLKLETFTDGKGDLKRATDTGKRIITCYPTASHISKNRYGIDKDIEYIKGINPFEEYL
jgi:hypothetical protein